MTLDDLRKIAQAATEGPWKWERPSEDDFPQHDQSLVTTWKEEDGEPATVLHGWGYDASGTEAEPQDRLFIATFNPAKVLELIDELDSYRRSLRKVVDRNVELAARLAAVEKLYEERCAETVDNFTEAEELFLADLIKAVRGE